MSDMLATTDDLGSWMQKDPPDTAIAILRGCSVLVLDATRLAAYAVDATGTPTDQDVLDAFRDATCIQAAAWVALGIDAFAGGIHGAGVATSKKIGSASITIAGAENVAAAKAFAAANLVPLAAQRLQRAGLLSTAVAHS